MNCSANFILQDPIELDIAGTGRSDIKIDKMVLLFTPAMYTMLDFDKCIRFRDAFA